MATTIDDIAGWVYADVLKRTDITAVVRTCAINVYRLMCAAVPFDELMVTSTEQAVVSGTASYDLAGLTPALRAIQSIRMTYSATNKRRLRRSSTRLYDSLSLIPSGQPATYARWGTKIELNPPPDSSAYTFRVRYWSRPAITDETTVLITPIEWDELLRWETLYRAYHELDQLDKAYALMAPPGYPRQGSSHKLKAVEVGIIPRLWNDLLSTVSAKENIDEDFSINPLNRNYSARVGGGW